jgi:Domain of unknown function (DUF1918)
MTRAGMRAVPGDSLVIDGDPERVCVVLSVPHPDGSPPYVVRWRRGGHIALVSPDSYSVLVPAGCQIKPAPHRAASAAVAPPGPGAAGAASPGTGR